MFQRVLQFANTKCRRKLQITQRAAILYHYFCTLYIYIYTQSLGGNIASASPLSDGCPLLLAIGASLLIGNERMQLMIACCFALIPVVMFIQTSACYI